MSDKSQETKPAKRTAKASQSKNYAVLIRHAEWIDRFARAVARDGFDAANMDAWASLNADDRGRFATPEEAKAHQEMLTALFHPVPGHHARYVFTVCVLKHVPRWYILDPKTANETNPVGSREQL